MYISSSRKISKLINEDLFETILLYNNSLWKLYEKGQRIRVGTDEWFVDSAYSTRCLVYMYLWIFLANKKEILNWFIKIHWLIIGCFTLYLHYWSHISVATIILPWLVFNFFFHPHTIISSTKPKEMVSYLIGLLSLSFIYLFKKGPIGGRTWTF